MPDMFRLKNGLRCVCDCRPGTGKVSVQICFKSGSLHEKLSEVGLTFLMQEACNGGTLTRSREQLAENFARMGSKLDTDTEEDITIFASTALSRDVNDVFAVLADVVRNPAFEFEEIQNTKAQIKQWIAELDEFPEELAEQRFYEAAYSGQALGSNPMGAIENLSSFTTEQVKRRHAELLSHPGNIVVSFSGDITAARAKHLVEMNFGDLQATRAPASPPQINFIGDDLRVANDNAQLNLMFGFPAPSLLDLDRYAAILLEEYLSGGMSSPLFQEIREKRGLVYDIHAEYSPYCETGFFAIVAGTGKGNARELMSITFDLLGKIIRDGLDQEQLGQCRARVIRGVESVVETADNSAERNAKTLLCYGKVPTVVEYSDRLKEVTPDDIRRVCAEMLSGGAYALAAVGPQKAMPSAQEIRRMIKAQVEGVSLPLRQPRNLTRADQQRPSEQPYNPGIPVSKSSVLSNGMRAVTLNRPGLLTCGAWVGVGADHEPADLNGASHMDEHMMFKGTAAYPTGAIDSIVERQLHGGSNACTSKDYTAYYFYNLKPDDLEIAVDMCGEMVFKANLNHGDFSGIDGNKGERDVVIEEIKRSNDDVEDCVEDLAYNIAYPNQPHGRRVLGTEATLGTMTVRQLAAYRDAFYVPNNVVFAAVGPIKHDDLVRILEWEFGDLPAKPVPPLPVPDYRGGTSFLRSDSAQTCNILVCAPSVPLISKDSIAYSALAEILGGDASSRLYHEIVFNQQLAPEISSRNDTFRNAGSFCVEASTSPKNIRPFIRTVYSELRRAQNDLNGTEVDKVKALLEMRLLDAYETNFGACGRYGRDALAHGRLVTQTELSAEIQNLDLEDVIHAASQVLSREPTVAGVIPKNTNARYLPTHEEVVAMRDGEVQVRPTRSATKLKSRSSSDPSPIG